MRFREIAVAAALLAASAGSLHAIDVVLAPIAMQHEGAKADTQAAARPEADLLRALAALQRGERPLVRRANPAGGAPRTLLEAARLCEAHGYGYLLYGWVQRTDYAFHAEVKLFDSEGGEVVAVFFGSDDERHYERLIEDVASKIVAYFGDEIGLSPQRESPRDRNLLSFPCAVGVWTPIAGEWSRVTTGLATVAAGARFVPVRPLFALGSRPGYAAFGLDVEYALGMNDPGYESFFLHMARVRLTLEADVEVADRHSVGLGLGPLLAIDTVAQDRLYDRLVVETTVAAGASFSLFYRYALSERAALGLSNVVDIAAYTKPLVVYSPRLFVDLALRPGRAPGGTE